jgi:hypothetical protein
MLIAKTRNEVENQLPFGQEGRQAISLTHSLVDLGMCH